MALDLTKTKGQSDQIMVEGEAFNKGCARRREGTEGSGNR